MSKNKILIMPSLINLEKIFAELFNFEVDNGIVHGLWLRYSAQEFFNDLNPEDGFRFSRESLRQEILRYIANKTYDITEEIRLEGGTELEIYEHYRQRELDILLDIMKLTQSELEFFSEYAEQDYYTNRSAKKIAPKNRVKVGDIFVATGGYEETRQYFYQVIAVVGRHTALVKSLMQKETHNVSSFTGTTIPLPDNFVEPNEDPSRYRIMTDGRNAPVLKLLERDATLWKGGELDYTCYG